MRRTASPYAVLQSLQRFRVAGGHVVAALSALQKCAAWERALLVLRDVRNDDPQRLAAYNSTISACERSGRWPWALHLHHDMPRAKLVPDVISYSAGISACDKSARWQAALGFLAEMRARRVRRDKFVCGASISACAKGGAWQRALLLYKAALDEGIQCDAIIYGASISACERGAQWQLGLALFTLGPQTAVTCAAAVSACGKATRWSAALHLLGCGAAAEVAMCAAISACASAAQWRWALHLRSSTSFAQGAAGNGAISACGDARQWQLAFDLLEEMNASQISTRTSYNAAISACHWDMAVWLYADMRRAAISPDTITFNALLQCTERWQVALALLWDMERLKVQKNLITAAASQKLCEERQMPKTSPQNAPRAKFSLPALLLAIDHGRSVSMSQALPSLGAELDTLPFLRHLPRLWLESSRGRKKKARAALPSSRGYSGAAKDVEAGGDPLQALRRGTKAAEETEQLALQSLYARLQDLWTLDIRLHMQPIKLARDCVRFAGGAEALERQVRETRAKAVRAVRPWIELLAEPRQCREVRQAMEIMLQETREEYNTTLSMKTAKAEVVQELQDRSSQQEWMIKQLQDAVELLEDSQLCTATAAMDLELFFLDALGSPMPQELCTRAGGCLRALVRCGRAAARVLEATGEAEGEESDVPETSPEAVTSVAEEPDGEAVSCESPKEAIEADPVAGAGAGKAAQGGAGHADSAGAGAFSEAPAEDRAEDRGYPDGLEAQEPSNLLRLAPAEMYEGVPTPGFSALDSAARFRDFWRPIGYLAGIADFEKLCVPHRVAVQCQQLWLLSAGSLRNANPGDGKPGMNRAILGRFGVAGHDFAVVLNHVSVEVEVWPADLYMEKWRWSSVQLYTPGPET
ncbi:unnamed protein product [Effrenium voratum]|uniref:Pentatricopeptide repeat-containing protein, chloroplastic n=1 Tax=Effrenium voratum TaxID=2562239 RepID=A0AA36I1H3_9DINO|nr:unnamed protein product [Effrenium voratum]